LSRASGDAGKSEAPADRPAPELPSNAVAFKGWVEAPPDDIPPPPYHVGEVDMLFVGVRFAEAAVRAILPAELKPVPEFTGTLCVYEARTGWGIAPYSACFAAIEVEGFDSPDGSRGYYMATGHFSGRAGVVMRRDYNTNFLEGGSRLWREAGQAGGIGGPPGGEALHLTLDRLPPTPPITSGIHHYLGRNAGGGINLYAVAFTGSLWGAVPSEVRIGPDAGTAMRALAGAAQPIWAFDCAGTTLTFSAPRPIADHSGIASEGTRAALLDVFSHLGRPAVVLGKNAAIAYMNRQAEGLVGLGFTVERGHLRARRSQDQAALHRIVEAAMDRGAAAFDLSPIAIERPDGTSPLIARALPIDAAISGGEAAALVLFSDPVRTGGGNPTRALQLMGLTPAEARIAALVGSGLAPKEAAEKLGNTEGTVRAALTQIYQKLDIGRQSELAKIVARLETIGP